jgi:hypothetical protein
MRFKIVPAPPDGVREDPERGLAALGTARDAVPLVPKPEADCCMRVVNAGVVGARDAASEWLTFGRALGLVAETDRGYHRVRDAPDPPTTGGRTTLAERFRENVFGAREVLDTLADADGAMTADAAFAAFRERMPNWERRRHTDAEGVWRDRVRYLLDWAVVFGLAEWADGYVAVKSGE